MSRSTRSRSLLLTTSLAVVLAVLAVPAGAQYFGTNRVQYRDFDWRIYHSTHFDVYYYTAEEHQLKKAVSLAESAYDELSRVFDYQIQEPTPLIVYQTHSAFLQNNIILNGVPEGAQAFASPVLFRMVLPLDLPDKELLALIKHELTHIFQYHILFRGKLGRGLRGAPPQWFIEGGASYFADDENASDKKYMIDAVVNDLIPSVRTPGGGFLAYRFGHAVFKFIEERWGQEAVLDLMYELRNTLGSRIGRAIERTFRMDVEDFDAEFRRWARQRYLPELLESGEPGDFGKPFRLEPGKLGQETSPAASPSGDLLAAVTTDKQEIDVSIFDTHKRRRLKILTKGLETQIRWIVAQSLTYGRRAGRDLAFSPDGNYLAAFGRRESGHSLVIIDVLNGGLRQIIDMDVEQQLAPAWHPDGRHIAFSGNKNGQFDIFVIDTETLTIENLTNDEIYDSAPVFSPDGRWLFYSAVVGEYDQIFRLDLKNPGQRFQETHGEWNSKEPVFSADGQRIYFASDRGGAVDNIYGLDLTSGELRQFTNSVTGCDQPTVLPLPEGGERLVYTGYWKGKFSLYTTDVEEPIGEPVKLELASQPAVMTDLERFEPDIEVTIDEDNQDVYGGKKFFVEDIVGTVGIDYNNFFLGRAIILFSDYLGDRRIIGDVAAYDSLSDFAVTYLDLSDRWQWSARVFNKRVQQFYRDPFDFTGRIRHITLMVWAGAEYSLAYPFSTKNRFEVTGGAYYRDFRFNFLAVTILNPEFDPEDPFKIDPDTGLPFPPVISFPAIPQREDVFPMVSAAFVRDSAIFNQFGAYNGQRIRLSASYAPNLDPGDRTPRPFDLNPGEESGTLFTALSLDARAYVALGRRSNFAFRFRGSWSNGEAPNVFFAGGWDTVRGYDPNQFYGYRGFYANAELRFPLINRLDFPGFRLQGIRGILFFDVGAAWFPQEDFDFYGDSDGDMDDELVTPVAAYGFGISVNLFGLPLNWDFAHKTKLDDDEASGYETQFWIGYRF